jgi:spore germination cell wall hydrolase CwlJ-like protein
VVGVVGAYAMTARASAHGAPAALGSLQAKLSPLVERAAPLVERAITLANDVARRMSMPEPSDVVVRPIPPASPLVAPPIASAGPVAGAEPIAAIEPVAGAPPADTAEWPAPLAPSAAADPPAMPAPVAPAIVTAEPPVPPVAASAVAPAESASEPVAEPSMPALAALQPQAPAQADIHNVPDAAPPAGTAAPLQPDTADDVVNRIEVSTAVWVLLPHPKPPPSPARLLDLQGASYDKAERCLAQAVYFEARNEPVRGQRAVAQVVMNRVFSPYYPKDVCSVVYQNAHRHLSCQFTFACDGKPEAIRERGAWARAQRIARQTLDAQIWLPEVAKATHYHAAYVRPNWIRDMRVMVRHGLHTFYRPRNWGDGSNELGWGTAAAAEATTPAPTVVAHKRRKG